MKKAIIIIGNILLALLIVIGLFVGVSLLPLKNNYKILAVMSGSMEPAIKTGSVVVTMPTDDYAINQIITFKTKSGQAKDYTTHRIYSIANKNDQLVFQTKGDANEKADFEPVNEDQVVGRTLFSLRYIGYLIGYVKTLPGLILIIVIPAAIIVYEELKKIHRETKLILEKRRMRKKDLDKNKIKSEKKAD